MHILGSIKKEEGKFFKFQVFHKDRKLHIKTFNLSGRNILVYIDGIIFKLSNHIKHLTADIECINHKIAYLYSINENLEGHIHGSFNIYLFDYSNNNLKIIRDSRGTRSVFYASLKNKFIFSSDTKFLLKEIENPTLNIRKLMDFLSWDYRSDTNTFFNEIKTIKPKHYLLFNNKEIFSSKYSFDSSLFIDSNNQDSSDDFKKYLYSPIKSISKTNKSLGLMMSGGLDSSAIAIALKENDIQDVRTYSANFLHISDSKNIDETEYQKNISDITSFKHTPISMENKSIILPIQKFTKIFDRPILFPNIYIFEEIIKKLKNDNINLVLDGNDGDNTVSHGFEVLYSYFRSFRLLAFIKEVYLYSRFKNSNFLRLLLYFIKEAFKTLLRFPNSHVKNTILIDSKKIKINPKNDINIFSSHERKLSIDLHFLANEDRNILFRYFNIENFSPFYDECLINFCINMDKKNKLHNGYTRKILREFLSKFLPEKHANRDKSILTNGLLKNFSSRDIDIIKYEYKYINTILLNLIDIKKLETIIESVDSRKEISESDLINLQIFVSANTFLNKFNF